MPDEHNVPTKTAWEALEYNDSIRLLVLQPAKARESTLYGELQLTTLSAYEQEIYDPYTAISYVWGDPEQVDEVQLGHTRVNITANLGAVLRDIRDANRILTIWVDALCINQDDIPERNQQVRIMGEIYRQASSTIIYLGPISQDIDLLFDISIERKRLDHANFNQLTGSIDKRWTVEEYPELLKAIEDLCSREWFTRSWVFQELVLSKHPRIQCSRRRLQWDTLMPLIQSISDEQGHCRLALAMHKARAIPNGLSFFDLLSSRCHSKATDPRDFIYSIIGLANDRQRVEKVVPIDYNIPPKDVFVRAARYLLQGSCDFKTLAPYCNLSALGEGFPSWVPDWGLQTNWLLQGYSWTRSPHAIDATLCLGRELYLGSKGIGDHFVSSNDIPPLLRDCARSLKSSLDEMKPGVRKIGPGTILDLQIENFWELWDAFIARNVSAKDNMWSWGIRNPWYYQVDAVRRGYLYSISEARLGIVRVVCEYVDQFSHHNIGHSFKRLGRIYGWPILLSSEVQVDDDIMYTHSGVFIMRPVNGISDDLEMGIINKFGPRFFTKVEKAYLEQRGQIQDYGDGIHRNFKIIESLGTLWWEFPESPIIPALKAHDLRPFFIF